MTTVWKIAAAVLAAAVLAVMGCYILLTMKSLWGAGLVLLALCVAFPTTIRAGIGEAAHGAHDLKEAGLIVLPVAIDTKVGGDRKFDPPAPMSSPAPHVDHGEGDETGEGR